MRETHGWFIWCGIGTVDEKHTEIRNLTKKEALSKVEAMDQGRGCSGNAPYVLQVLRWSPFAIKGETGRRANFSNISFMYFIHCTLY